MKMHHTLIIVSLLLASVYAQKPTSGTVTAEVALNGAINNINIDLVQGARVRYFLGDNLALRVGFLFDSRRGVDKVYENPDGTGGVGEQKNTYTRFGILPGVEYHFEGSEKLSTFIGTYLLFNASGARTERKNYIGGVYAANFTQIVNGSSAFGRKETTFGVGLYSGFDWYFVEKLYLGIEWGIVFQSVSVSDVVTETSVGGITTKTVQPGGAGGGFSTAAVGALRLGYQF